MNGLKDFCRKCEASLLCITVKYWRSFFDSFVEDHMSRLSNPFKCTGCKKTFVHVVNVGKEPPIEICINKKCVNVTERVIYEYEKSLCDHLCKSCLEMLEKNIQD